MLGLNTMDSEQDRLGDNGKTKEELERELQKLKRKLKVSRCQLQQTRSQMEVQGLRTRQLVTAWTARLEQTEEKLRKQKLQKDLELRGINAHLMLLQGQLKREQQFIMSELSKKNKLIKRQRKTIQKLGGENIRLQEALVTKKEEPLDDQYVTLASIDEMIKRKNSAQILSSVNGDCQGAFDSSGRKSQTHSKLGSSDINLDRDLTQTSFSDMNITQDDVFKDTSFDLSRDVSAPDLTTNIGSNTKEPRARSITIGALDPSVEYSNHKIFKRRKKPDNKMKSPHGNYQGRSKHMSLDIDLNKSFDSVTFAESRDGYYREGQDDVHWYFSSSDKENEQAEDLASQSFIISDAADSSVRGFDRRTDGMFYRDVENVLRHKTVKRKRKRSKSLSDTARMPVIFLAQSEPDIAHTEINIDEAIVARKHRHKMQIV